MDKRHFYALAAHAAQQPVSADRNAQGYSDVAELQRELALMEERQAFGERDFQNFLKYCRLCSQNRHVEWEWQTRQVINVWGYPRGVFCKLADNGHPFVEVDDELAALYGL